MTDSRPREENDENDSARYYRNTSRNAIQAAAAGFVPCAGAGSSLAELASKSTVSSFDNLAVIAADPPYWVLDPSDSGSAIHSKKANNMNEGALPCQ